MSRNVSFWEWAFPVEQYETPTRRYSAWVVYAIIALIGVGYLFYAAFVPEWQLAGQDGPLTLLEIALRLPTTGPAVIFYGLYALAALGYLMNRRGMLAAAGWVPIMMWYFSGVTLNILTTPSPGDASGGIILLLVLGALLRRERGIVAAWALALFTLILRDLSSDIYAGSLVTVPSVMVQFTGGALLISLFLRYARFNRLEAAQDALEDRASANVVLAYIANQVAARVPTEQLLAETEARVVAQFDAVEQARVIIFDMHERDANSTPLKINFSGQPVIATDTATFPLRLGEDVIGVVEVHAEEPDGLRDESLLGALQALADSIALAIDNRQQFERAEERLKENQRLVEETRKALRQVERLNARLTSRAWSDYLHGERLQLNQAVDFETSITQPQTDWTPTLQRAIRDDHLIQQQVEDKQVIAVPLRVRGQVIGAMEFELDENREFSPEDLEIIREVSDQFEVAVENARLVDRSQRSAEREALVSQISNRMQTADNPQIILTETAQSLRSALKAERVSIRLGQPEDETA